jgi:hypothetical protein
MYSKFSYLAVFAFLWTLSSCCSRAAYAVPPSDACSLLTQAQVSTALGVEVEAAQHVAPTLCQWSAPNQPNSINAKKVTLTISNERAWEYAKTPVGSSLTTMPASGICDDAVYTTIKRVTPGLGTTLYVKKGSSYFVVHVYGFPDQAKAMAMEKTLATQACSKL